MSLCDDDPEGVAAGGDRKKGFLLDL